MAKFSTAKKDRKMVDVVFKNGKRGQMWNDIAAKLQRKGEVFHPRDWRERLDEAAAHKEAAVAAASPSGGGDVADPTTTPTKTDGYVTESDETEETTREAPLAE